MTDIYRNKLIKYVAELLHDHLFENLKANLSKIQDPDRYFNWYKGYSALTLPSTDEENFFTYNLVTRAPSGTIWTEDFGEKFNADNVEERIHYDIQVLPPESIEANTNVTLHFVIEKVQIPNKYLSIYNGNNYLSIGGNDGIDEDDLKVELKFNANNSAHIIGYRKEYGHQKHISKIFQHRYAPKEAVAKMNLQFMPGFKLTWFYTGIDQILMKDYEGYRFDTGGMRAAFIR